MKLTKIIFPMICFVLTLAVKAQTAELSWGPERVEKGDVSFVGAMDDRFFTTRTEKKNFFLESFDLMAMTSLSSEKILLKEADGKTKISLIRQFLFKNKVILLGTVYQKKLKTHKLKWLVANDSGLVEKEWVELIPSIENRKNCIFKVELSTDKEQIIVQVIAFNEDEKDRIHTLYILDAALNITWKQEVKASDDQHYLQIERIKTVKNGSIYLFARSVPLDKKKNAKASSIIRQYLNGNTQYNEFVISVGNKSLITSSLNLNVDERGYVSLCGYYQDYEDGKPAMAGTFLLKFNNQQLESPTLVFSEFNLEFRVKMIEFLHRESNAEKGTEFFEDYRIQALVTLADGGYIGIMELAYSQRYAVSNGSSTTYNYTYHSGHILAIRIDPNGKILWDREIKKAGPANYLYYGTYSRNDTINMIFYDAWENFNEDGTRKISGVELGDPISGLITIAQLSPDGNIGFEPLVDMRNSKIRPWPAHTSQLNKYMAFIFGDSNNKPIRFGLIRF